MTERSRPDFNQESVQDGPTDTEERVNDGLRTDGGRTPDETPEEDGTEPSDNGTPGDADPELMDEDYQNARSNAASSLNEMIDGMEELFDTRVDGIHGVLEEAIEMDEDKRSDKNHDVGETANEALEDIDESRDSLGDLVSQASDAVNAYNDVVLENSWGYAESAPEDVEPQELADRISQWDDEFVLNRVATRFYSGGAKEGVEGVIPSHEAQGTEANNLNRIRSNKNETARDRKDDIAEGVGELVEAYEERRERFEDAEELYSDVAEIALNTLVAVENLEGEGWASDLGSELEEDDEFVDEVRDIEGVRQEDSVEAAEDYLRSKAERMSEMAHRLGEAVRPSTGEPIIETESGYDLDVDFSDVESLKEDLTQLWTTAALTMKAEYDRLQAFEGAVDSVRETLGGTADEYRQLQEDLNVRNASYIEDDLADALMQTGNSSSETLDNSAALARVSYTALKDDLQTAVGDQVYEIFDIDPESEGATESLREQLKEKQRLARAQTTRTANQVLDLDRSLDRPQANREFANPFPEQGDFDEKEETYHLVESAYRVAESIYGRDEGLATIVEDLEGLGTEVGPRVDEEVQLALQAYDGDLDEFRSELEALDAYAEGE